MLRRHVIQAIAIASLFYASPAVSDPVAATPQITIVGNGLVSVVPDIARINIGVREDAETAADAMAAMRDAMNKVFDQISAAGVAPADMRTGTIRLQRLYDSSLLSSGSQTSGFEASTSVTVIVRDINDLGPVLDAVVEDGANNIDGLQFDVADRAPHVLLARQSAVKDARAAAEVYAMAAGVTLGGVISIRETHTQGGNFAVMEMVQSRSGATPVAAGELDIARSVEIIYALQP